MKMGKYVVMFDYHLVKLTKEFLDKLDKYEFCDNENKIWDYLSEKFNFLIKRRKVLGIVIIDYTSFYANFNSSGEGVVGYIRYSLYNEIKKYIENKKRGYYEIR